MSNYRVKTFVSGLTTFTASTANGVYVERGDASGKIVMDRIVVTGTGAVHDLDGTDDAPLIPRELWNEFTFVGANPNAHTQYQNLITLLGKHGTLTMTVPTASSEVTYTKNARLTKIEGKWEPPYQAGVKNWLTIRVTWRLKEL